MHRPVRGKAPRCGPSSHEEAEGSSWTTPAPTPTRAHGRTLRSMAFGVQRLSSVSHHKGSLLGAHCLLSPFQKHRETKSSDLDDPLGALCVGTICVFVAERTEAWGWQVFQVAHWWGLRTQGGLCAPCPRTLPSSAFLMACLPRG